jgi:hypothetical protein
MRINLGLGVAAGLAALAFAPAANATTYPVGSPNFFITSGTPFTPSITAIFFNSFTSKTTFDDVYTFTIPQNGVGSGSISTSFSSKKNKLTITDLIVNGVSYVVPSSGSGQSITLNGVPILNGILNTIEVKGFVAKTGSYSGTVTFAATAVPEAATWGMMLGGFAMIGATMRRRRTAVRFA